MKLFYAFLLILFVSLVHGQSPALINYQAIALDNTGKAISNSDVQIQLSIREGQASGAIIYSESHSVKTNSIGLFSLQIGGGNASGSSFESIDWGSANKFLEVSIDANNTSDFVSTGVFQLVSVPYALYSQRSGGDGDSSPANELISQISFDSETGILQIREDTSVQSVVLPTYSGAYYYQDSDKDGYGNPKFPVWVPTGVNAPLYFVNNSDDCNDENASINPMAMELCDGLDNDCDGIIDNDVTTTYYRDADSDGYGDPDSTTQACSLPEGFVENADDCDDSDSYNKPGTPLEICDGVDNDCDGLIDEECVISACVAILTQAYNCVEACGEDTNCANECMTSNPEVLSCSDFSCSLEIYVNQNSYFDATWTSEDKAIFVMNHCGIVDQDGDGINGYNGDCDDLDDTVYPGAEEVCSDGIDNNCSGSDHLCGDDDFDGYVGLDDCDNTDPTINIGAIDICGDLIDNDCDGVVDNGVDMDEDGYTTCDGDCDDMDASIYPGAPDPIDGRDTNCDGLDGTDADGDGYTSDLDCDDTNADIYPGNMEICDGLDNDCSGFADDGGCLSLDYSIESILPPILYNGVENAVTINTIGFTETPAEVQLISFNYGPYSLEYSAMSSNELEAIIPVGITASTTEIFGLKVIDSAGHYTSINEAVQVTDNQEISILSVTPDTVSLSVDFDVTVYVSTIYGVELQDKPYVFVNPSSGGTAIWLKNSVTFLDAATIQVSVATGLIPTGETYDLILINPDGSCGISPNALTVEP
ncbi:putative metal-binding motif-containing protein [Marinoscillum sp. MHG1-6]|uniref:putative metal-binding motif-containing protein n=1 Tax=Marinoscillum sp. MHG1-6 TaxID=2959627 RepID=UPI00215824D6|nr:putative metal-binding motif-containing protein [Marinoscillum sp. MHG1-6]